MREKIANFLLSALQFKAKYSAQNECKVESEKFVVRRNKL